MIIEAQINKSKCHVSIRHQTALEKTMDVSLYYGIINAMKERNGKAFCEAMDLILAEEVEELLHD